MPRDVSQTLAPKRCMFHIPGQWNSVTPLTDKCSTGIKNAKPN